MGFSTVRHTPRNDLTRLGRQQPVRASLRKNMKQVTSLFHRTKQSREDELAFEPLYQDYHDESMYQTTTPFGTTEKFITALFALAEADAHIKRLTHERDQARKREAIVTDELAGEKTATFAVIEAHAQIKHLTHERDQALKQRAVAATELARERAARKAAKVQAADLQVRVRIAERTREVAEQTREIAEQAWHDAERGWDEAAGRAAELREKVAITRTHLHASERAREAAERALEAAEKARDTAQRKAQAAAASTHDELSGNSIVEYGLGAQLRAVEQQLRDEQQMRRIEAARGDQLWQRLVAQERRLHQLQRRPEERGTEENKGANVDVRVDAYQREHMWRHLAVSTVARAASPV